MSKASLYFVKNLKFNNVNNVNILIRNFSRRTSNAEDPFKIVKPGKTSRDEAGLAFRNPSYDRLVASSGFPFFMPGNISPAWYDIQTTAQARHDFVMEQTENVQNTELDGNVICRVQVCPTLLRQTVCDLFPYRNLENSILSVITIFLKPDLKHLRKNKEMETEKMAQIFVLTSKSICDKLKNSGYWADFINPFSGRPYLFPTIGSPLYENDEKFRCLDFQIFEIQDCKVISNEEDKSKRRFIGSLFTNAPSQKNRLNNIFTQ